MGLSVCFVLFDDDKCFMCLDLLVFYCMFSTFAILGKTFQRGTPILLNDQLFFPSTCMVSSLTLKCLIVLEYLYKYILYNVLYIFSKWPDYFMYFFLYHVLSCLLHLFENSIKESL